MRSVTDNNNNTMMYIIIIMLTYILAANIQISTVR